ncbi:MAG: hypothetical protein K2X67_03500 [Burkholderiales bacterium]|nr:hypothetical protein [Burkholderiales bacterium]
MSKPQPTPAVVLQRLDNRERELAGLRTVVREQQAQITQAMADGIETPEQRKQLAALASELDGYDAELDGIDAARKIAQANLRTGEAVARYDTWTAARDQLAETLEPIGDAYRAYLDHQQLAEESLLEARRLSAALKAELWQIYAATFPNRDHILGVAGNFLAEEVLAKDALGILDRRLNEIGVQVGRIEPPAPKPTPSLRPSRPEATKPAETALPRPKGLGRVYPGYGAFIKETDPNASPSDPRNMPSVPPQPKPPQPKAMSLAEAAPNSNPLIDPNILADGPPKHRPV